jgi:hypothetical protein
MRYLWLNLVAFGCSTTAFAQGYVAFSNHVIGDTPGTLLVDAPVFDTDCRTRLAGAAYLAQFYAGLTPGALQPAGQISPFSTGIAAGYVYSATDANISGATEGQIVYVQMRAWQASAGPRYETAVAGGGKYGFSNIVPEAAVLPPGGPGNWPVGLQSFCLFSGLPPKLTATLNGAGNVTLTWTVPSNGFVLQRNSRLGSTNWVTITNAVSGAGSGNQFQVPAAGRAMFYRLVHPEPSP